ncbi:MAG: 5-(carboxyamino)imidazole ribonucleotide mutase [Methanomassiliicoccales archaeon]|nr:MAG: 5-(carboxyamino)imidazole ribonucleotide mutase [Methanomassiliicoccales archaeon]
MDVMIILGSETDMEVAEKAMSVFDLLGVDYEINIASAHRTPERVKKLVKDSKAKIFIAIAGLSAALPGVIASYTLKPVIGVPVSGKLNIDAVFSILQMPPGVPVGAVGLDNGQNAALFAAEILAIKNKKIDRKLMEYRKRMKDKVIADSKKISSN